MLVPYTALEDEDCALKTLGASRHGTRLQKITSLLNFPSAWQTRVCASPTSRYPGRQAYETSSPYVKPPILSERKIGGRS